MGEQKLADIPGIHSKEFVLDNTVDADTDRELPLFAAEEEMEVTEVQLIPRANAAGHDDNRRIRSLINKGTNGAGATVVASKDYVAGVSLLAFRADTLTLSATEANLRLAKGDVVALKSQIAGLGVAEPEMAVKVSYLYKKAPTA